MAANSTKYHVRDLDEASDPEVHAVVRWCLETVLATVPEFDNSPEKARAVLPNFTFGQMLTMVREDFGRPTHRFLVAVDEVDRLVGHSMISRKLDEDGLRFGYLFTWFVLPEHRRRGAGSRLLAEAVKWLQGEGCEYLLAHTHASNKPARAFFERNGFGEVARQETPWKSVTLRRDTLGA